MYINAPSDLNALPEQTFRLRMKTARHENHTYRLLERREKKKLSNLFVAVALAIVSVGIAFAIPKFRKFWDTALSGKKITHYVQADLVPDYLPKTLLTPSELKELLGKPISKPTAPQPQENPEAKKEALIAEISSIDPKGMGSDIYRLWLKHPEMRAMPEFAKAAIAKTNLIKREEIPESVQKDRAFWLDVSKGTEQLFLRKGQFPLEWLKDADFMREASLGNKQFFEDFYDPANAPEALLEDREFWLKMANFYVCNAFPEQIGKFPEQWRADPAFMKEMILHKNFDFSKYIAAKLKKNKSFYEELLKSEKFAAPLMNRVWEIYKELPEELKSEKKWALNAVRHADILLDDIPEILKQDESFMLEIVWIKPSLIEKSPLKDNLEFCRKAVEKENRVYDHLKEEFQNDQEILLKATRRFYVAERWAAKAPNEEVALSIVRTAGNLLFHLPDPYRHDPLVILTAICRSPTIFQNLAPEEKKLLSTKWELLAQALAELDAPNPEATALFAVYKYQVDTQARAVLEGLLEEEGVDWETFYKKVLELNGMALFRLPRQLFKNEEFRAAAKRQNPKVADFLV